MDVRVLSRKSVAIKHLIQILVNIFLMINCFSILSLLCTDPDYLKYLPDNLYSILSFYNNTHELDGINIV